MYNTPNTPWQDVAAAGEILATQWLGTTDRRNPVRALDSTAFSIYAQPIPQYNTNYFDTSKKSKFLSTAINFVEYFAQVAPSKYTSTRTWRSNNALWEYTK